MFGEVAVLWKGSLSKKAFRKSSKAVLGAKVAASAAAMANRMDSKIVYTSAMKGRTSTSSVTSYIQPMTESVHDNKKCCGKGCWNHERDCSELKDDVSEPRSPEVISTFASSEAVWT